MFLHIRNILKKYAPPFLLAYVASISRFLVGMYVVFFSPYIKRRSPSREKVKVCFFVIHRSVWKLDNLYRLLEKDKRFEPMIVMCPYMSGGREVQDQEMDEGYSYFTSLGYTVVSTKDENGRWRDIRKELDPDIVFFTNPHNVTLSAYQWRNFRDRYTCYVPYHHQVDFGQWGTQWNSPFHLSMWKLFYINRYHKNLAIEKMLNKGANVEVVGYPGTEGLYLNIPTNNPTRSVWKVDDGRKKIIFAPHHTIEFDPVLGISDFLDVADRMVDLAMQLSSQVVFAFKPHPVLKSKLYKHPEWGKVRTDKYYNFWRDSENTQIEEGAYVDLFLQSDAMIHDSGSFLAEYLYLNKPVFYFFNETTKIRFNEFGHECLKYCVVGDISTVEKFILDVINGIDPLYLERGHFIRSDLVTGTEDDYPSMRIYKSISTLISK